MIVFDVETTGLDEKVNGVVGLGAVMLPGGITFYGEPRLIDELEAHPKALEVNGFTEEEIRSKTRIKMADILDSFVSWAKHADDMILAGWNTTFDYRFLSAEFERCGIDWPFGYRVVDIQSIAYTVMRIRDQWTPMHDGLSTVGLNYTLKWLKLPPEPDPHNALTGAQCNVDALLALSKMISVVPVVDKDEPEGIEVEQLTLVGPATHIPTSTGSFTSEDENYQAWLSNQENL